MADISVLIAHKREPANDTALDIALEMLADNTAAEYELLIDDTTPKDPYVAYNDLAAQAACEWIVFLNSDTFAGPGWDAPMLEAASHNTIVTPVLVECGSIGVNVMNFERNFGNTPASFKRAEFERFVTNGGEWRDGEGWYMPSLHPRDEFLALGGFPTHRGTFGIDQIDTMYWETWKEAGNKVKRVRSWFYHLQWWSSEFEQEKRGYEPINR